MSHPPPGCCLLLIAGALLPMPARAAPPKVGMPHAPLVLWRVEGDRPLSLDAFRGKKVLVVHFASWSPESRRALDRWREETRPLVKEDRLVLLGVMQEQHRDRCRLFAQWRSLDFPLLHDPLNLAGVTRLPTVVAVDEQGLVRAVDPKPETLAEEFLDRKFKARAGRFRPPVLELPDPKLTRRMAGESREVRELREHGDALVLGGIPKQIDEAIAVYEQALRVAPRDAASAFRRGVAYFIRHDRPERQPGDFQAAIDAWRQAVRLDPDNRIYQSRVRQYGPRHEKRAALYAWIKKARREIAGRGEEPVALDAEPLAVERAKPRKKFKSTRAEPPELDSREAAAPDGRGVIDVESVIVRGLDPGQYRYAQVLLIFRPAGRPWSDDTSSLRVWLDPPDAIRLSRRFIKSGRSPGGAADDGARTVGFEVRLPRSGPDRPVKIHGLALCRVAGATTDLVRRDFEVIVPPEPAEPGDASASPSPRVAPHVPDDPGRKTP